MNQARLSSSFLTLLFCFSAGSAQDSPLEWHRFLREAFIARREVASDLREFIDRSGDHSFDSLLHYSERKRIALRMQKVAWQAWDDGNYTHAVRIYRQSAEQLLQEGARSEAAFCFYYIAEIHAEQEDFSESLAWLERAAQASGSRERPYLEALLQQSRGYCFWFTDHLQASVHAFSMALEHWQRLHFQAGVVATWNNLASLYEELGLWERARSCYQKALQQVDLSLDPEMLFYLHANYALFSHQRSHTTQALHHLNQARQLKAVSPEEFLILESQILGAKSRVHDLLSLRSELPSLRIEKALVLGRFFEKREKDTRAYHYFDQAYQESKESGLRYFTRKTALHLGHWLETHHRYREAADLYFEVYRGEENIRVPELAFPYSRAVSPIFDGWIRCLVRLGRTHEAWLAIQDLLEMRRIKAERFKQVAPQIRYVRNELDQLVVVGKLEGQSPVPISLEALPSAEKSLLFKLPAALLRRFSIVEMWPDQEKVYVWIRQASGRTFREVTFPGKVDEAIRNGATIKRCGNSIGGEYPSGLM